MIIIFSENLPVGQVLMEPLGPYKSEKELYKVQENLQSEID